MASPMFPQDPEITIAHRLRIAREDKTGLSQPDFAGRIQRSPKTVQRYEDPSYRGTRDGAVIASWALACGVSTNWLRGLDGPGDGGVRSIDSVTLRKLRVCQQPLSTSNRAA